jgi:cell wall-associated NlpC family hydrolase
MITTIILRLNLFMISVVALPCCTGEGTNQPAGSDSTAIVITGDSVESTATATLPSIDHTTSAFDTTRPDSIVNFARMLIGVPYLYASTDPAKGFDCSGFITYVFNHFNISVPRSSVDFTNYGRDISISESKPGDLILFTGTDSAIRIVGHMGIIESKQQDTLRFIHSTSGKLKGVVITPLGDYYKKRFVKIIRVFPDKAFE